MKVKELIEKLNQMDQEAEVMIPDYWPYPAHSNTCNDVLIEENIVLLVHVEPNIWDNKS